MKKVGLLIVGAIAVFFAVNFVYHTAKSFRGQGLPPLHQLKESAGVGDFIVANPLDLSEIAGFSKFRSCMGHDYSGKNTQGELETNRSMKHYIIIKSSLTKAKARAPFAGRVDIRQDQAGRGDYVEIVPDANPSYLFVFFHTDPVPKYANGGHIKAGELVGYRTVGEAKNFDMALKKFEPFKGPIIFDSPFLHMTDEVLAEYEQHGITPEGIIIPKEERDAAPCVFAPGSGGEDQVFLK